MQGFTASQQNFNQQSSNGKQPSAGKFVDYSSSILSEKVERATLPKDQRGLTFKNKFEEKPRCQEVPRYQHDFDTFNQNSQQQKAPQPKPQSSQQSRLKPRPIPEEKENKEYPVDIEACYGGRPLS